MAEASAGDPHLVASFFTLAGAGFGEPPRHGFAQRCEAAAGAGFTGTLFQWWRDVADGNLDRRNVVIILRDQSGRDVARWAFRDALPTKYSGPSFRAQGNEVAIESIELAVESMELEQ